MTGHQRKYFSGASLDSALMQAARYHGVSPEEIAYRKVEKKHGFLRMRKAVVIEVDPESPRLDSAAPTAPSEPSAGPTAKPTVEVEEPTVSSPPAEAPEESEEESHGGDLVLGEADDVNSDTEAPGARERDHEAGDEIDPELMDAAAKGLEQVLEFALLDLEEDVRSGDGELEIELTGPDRERLIEDRGNLLLSIQHLLPRLIRGHVGRSIPCHVDSEGFHENREVELRQLAEEAAAEVREGQRSRTLPPMNPAERRIIHVTLADEKDLSTESQGRGFFKRVTISPASRRPRGFDRYS